MPGAVVDVEKMQLAGLHVRDVVDLVHHLHGVGQQVVERVGAAAIGHVQDVDAGAVLQHLEPQVRRGAEPRRTVGQLAGVGLGVVDHLLEGLGTDGGMHREAGDEIADARDRHEAVGVVRRLAHVRQHGERRVGAHQEGVAVAGRLRGRLGADHAAGAGAVLDDELLPERLAELLRPGPADQVAAAARRVRNDELDRLVRPVATWAVARRGKPAATVAPASPRNSRRRINYSSLRFYFAASMSGERPRRQLASWNAASRVLRTLGTMMNRSSRPARTRNVSDSGRCTNTHGSPRDSSMARRM